MSTTKTAAPAETINRMFAAGKGVLVLDRYAEACAIESRLGKADMDEFVIMALTAPALDEVVSTVLLTLDGLLSSAQVRGTLGFGRSILAGACLNASAVTSDVVDQVRSAGATVVELRANLGPGDTGAGQPATEASALARAARAAQDAGLLPILTFAMPDLGTQSLNVTYAVTANALRGLITACEFHGVDLAQLVVRTNMVAPGSSALDQADARAVGQATISVLSEYVPAAVGGVLLLSGGIDLDRACAQLTEVVASGSDRDLPWPVSFGFARPLVASAARRWDGSSMSPVARMALTSACRRAADALHTTGASR